MSDDIELRPATETDLPLLHRLISDPAATGDYEWHGYSDPHLWRRRWEENGLLGQDSGALMIAASDESIGFVAWHKHSTGRSSFCWNIGIAIAPEARGLGHGTKAQRQLAEYLFSHTQTNRVEAGTEVNNMAEQRALEKAGFVKEGIMRGATFQGGQWHDAIIYSILRSDLLPHRD